MVNAKKCLTLHPSEHTDLNHTGEHRCVDLRRERGSGRDLEVRNKLEILRKVQSVLYTRRETGQAPRNSRGSQNADTP